MQLVRGVAPLISARLAARAMPGMEARWLAAGAGTQPLGAGGAADTRARPASAAATTRETRS
jgi:hypothetical protein